MPEDVGIKVSARTHSRFMFLGLFPLFTLREEVWQPETPGPRRTHLQEVLQQPVPEGGLQLRSRQIAAASAVDVDELAEVDKAISDQYLRASEVRVDIEVNNLYVEFNKETAMSYKGLLAQMKVARLKRVMTTMPKDNLAAAFKELQDLMGGVVETTVAPTSRRGDTTTRREPQVTYRSLRVNGTVVPAGQTRVNVPNGHIILDPAPGPQGYDEGTQVTLIAHPNPGFGVTWQRAYVEGPFRAIVTMDRNRQVLVTITRPPQPGAGGGRPPTAPKPGAPPAGGGAAVPPGPRLP